MACVPGPGNGDTHGYVRLPKAAVISDRATPGANQCAYSLGAAASQVRQT